MTMIHHYYLLHTTLYLPPCHHIKTTHYYTAYIFTHKSTIPSHVTTTTSDQQKEEKENVEVLQLDSIKKPVPPIRLPILRPPSHHHGPPGRHCHTLLGPENPKPKPSQRTPDTRVRSQLHVAILRHGSLPHSQLQRLRTRPRFLW